MVSVVASYYNMSSIDDIGIDISMVCMTSLESGYSELVGLVVCNSVEHFAGDSMGTDSDTGIGFDLGSNVDFDIDLGKNSGLGLNFGFGMEDIDFDWSKDTGSL